MPLSDPSRPRRAVPAAPAVHARRGSYPDLAPQVKVRPPGSPLPAEAVPSPWDRWPAWTDVPIECLDAFAFACECECIEEAADAKA